MRSKIIAMKRFRDRSEAGRLLADAVARLKLQDPVVYALPRGGVPVAAEVARVLKAPFDLIFVRKLGAPGHTELAMGAVVDGATPVTVLNNDVVQTLGVSESAIAEATQRALKEIERRRSAFADNLHSQPGTGRNVVIVDDGVATGATMEAAVKAQRQAGAKRIIVAAPVMPQDAIDRFTALADDVVCLETPTPFYAVGTHYADFRQLADDDVLTTLRAMKGIAMGKRPLR